MVKAYPEGWRTEGVLLLYQAQQLSGPLGVLTAVDADDLEEEVAAAAAAIASPAAVVGPLESAQLAVGCSVRHHHQHVANGHLFAQVEMIMTMTRMTEYLTDMSKEREAPQQKRLSQLESSLAVKMSVTH
jgi:hypothetical protein